MALYRGKKQKRRWFRRSRYSSNYRTRRSTRIRNIVFVVLGLAVLFAVGFFVLEPMLERWLVRDGEDTVSTVSGESSSPSSTEEIASSPSPTPSSQETSSAVTEPESTAAPAEHAVRLTAEQFGQAEILSRCLTQAKEQGAGLVLLEVKGKDGQLSYRSVLDAVDRIGAVKEDAVDLTAVIAAIRAAGLEAGVSVTVFDEDYTASKLRTTAIKYAGSETTRWLNFEHQYRQDPGLEAAKEYELDILRELATYDLTVISLSGCHYPVWGDLSSCTCDATRTREENITDFISAARGIVNQAGVRLDVTVPADVAVGDRHSCWRYYGYPADLSTLDCDSVTADLRMGKVFNRYYNEIQVDGVGYADLTQDGGFSARLLYGAAFTRLEEIGVLTDRTVGEPASCFALFSDLGAEKIVCEIPVLTTTEE